ncbi:MAG: hypothetical protein POELPBGB_03017 [Bacteroidia bacterium]|nr:hypothetical protein [Bacteroidia bacterium]
MNKLITLKLSALLVIATLTLWANKSYSQCGTIPVVGDLIISSDQQMTGTWNITGTFQVDAGVTVTVTPYSVNGCGELIINAANINIQGNINGDFAGYTGGSGGTGATTGTNTTYLANCADKDNCYTVTVSGGTQGTAGNGTGAGSVGTAGGNGFGPKQACENFGDTYGLIGAGGGAGAGGGGSYGANANAGGGGGAGSASGSFTGMSLSTCSTPTAGTAGTGGTAGTAYGTTTGNDIDMGSGGAGASGGGKSYNNGANGGAGGTGGGKIVLNASETLTVAGTLSAQGSVGGNGGNGGAGGKTGRCCDDGCDGCDETTYSAGAGGGGGAGGGSGGGIYISALGDMTLTGTIRAEGGNGGLGGQGGAGASPCNYGGSIFCGSGNSGATNAGANGAMGGGGSGGRVKVFQNPCRNNVINANVLLSGGNGNGGAASTGTVHYGNLPGIVAPTGAAVASNVSCFGGTDGTATATASGGLPPYTYLWDDVNAQTTDIATGLSQGTYTVTITDDNGCSATATATLTEPTQLTASASVISDASCNGAADAVVDVTAGGGTPNYTYLWDDTNAQTTSSATGLGAGTFTVTVTDDNGCTATSSVTVSEPALLSATVVADNNVSCNAGADGQATVTVTGGTPNYIYEWDDLQSTPTAVNLPAGTIGCLITDAAGCTTTVSVTITEPTPVSGSATEIVSILCNGGGTASAVALGAGGTPGYTYLWDDNATTANDTVVNLPAGTYTVTITDTNQCTGTATVTINEPDVLTATVAVDSDVDCNGGNNGQLTVTPVGGTAPYTYLWNDPLAQTGQTAAGLEAGIYAVTVTDDNGCEVNVSNVQIAEPTALDVTLSSTSNVSCNGAADGQATVTAAGGVPPYLYDWNDPANQTLATANNLAPGTYDVTITDDNGCTFNLSGITITEPTVLTAGIASFQNVNCNGGNDGQATGGAFGGTGPYTYFWTPSGSSDATITDLTAGEYILLVTDANGCTDSELAIISEPVNPLVANFTADPDTGLQPLVITFTNTSVGATSYQWFFGDGETSTEVNPTHTYVDSGAFTIILVAYDSITGCTDTLSVTGGIYVIPTSIFEVPNVFTPNGDGLNDLFNPNSRNIVQFEGEIFNRWGEKVYGWTQPQGGWNGRTPSGNIVPEGTYFYTLKAVGVDNLNYEQKGSITLVR